MSASGQQFPDYKKEIFLESRETKARGKKRGLSIVRKMMRSVKMFGTNMDKQVCHLIISHEEWVDTLGDILDFLVEKFFPYPYLYIPSSYLQQLCDSDKK